MYFLEFQQQFYLPVSPNFWSVEVEIVCLVSRDLFVGACNADCTEFTLLVIVLTRHSTSRGRYAQNAL